MTDIFVTWFLIGIACVFWIAVICATDWTYVRLDISWRARRWMERLHLTIAWALPRWLVYWAVIRATTHATTGIHGRTDASDIRAVTVLKRWGASNV